MKKVIFMLTVVLLALIVGCTKEREVIVVVPNVEVHLNTKSVFNVEQEGFSTRSTTTEYQHVYPTEFKAYFIADESKGPYTKGQLVTTLNVTEGIHTITVPKLRYKVYVTNFEHTSDGWYTWNKPLDQMPLASDVLFLFGSSEIDYGTQLTGEVLVKNPWSAIMIKNHELFDSLKVPLEYTSGENYTLTDGWWLLYVRNRHNTEVWMKYPGATQSTLLNLTLNVEPNKIYKYKMTAPYTDQDGNFTVTTETFDEEIIEVNWELW